VVSLNNKSKLKIAVIIGELTHIGGVTIAVTKEVENLKKLGFDAELVLLHRNNKYDFREVIGQTNIPIRFLSDDLNIISRFSFRFPFFTFFSFFHLSAILWAPKLIRKYGYNVLLIHETYNCLSGVFCAKHSKAKLISYYWDPVSYIVPRIYGKKFPAILMPLVKKLSSSIDKFILKNSDVILIGSGLHEKLIESLCPSKKIYKIPAGTEVRRTISKKREKIIVSLTKWDRGKRPEFLLDVAKEIKGDFRFFIGGNWTDREQRNEFEEKIKELGLENKIILLGRVSEKEKFLLFAKSRVLIHPIVEAFGMFALEAAACGCPFIIPKKSGVTELFIEGQGGYFPQEGDIKEYVDEVNLLLSDDALAEKMGLMAWKIAKKYTWQAHAEKILSAIENLQN